ncbi:hypothetical protein KCP74_03955 [Salmonella enterica subsp. enterica]|nr:hypothetical protein KCP74_03955 [Salmonella enterica subsp. enterica]
MTGFISRNHDGENSPVRPERFRPFRHANRRAGGRFPRDHSSDVAGVYSADPRKVKDARLLPLPVFGRSQRAGVWRRLFLHARNATASVRQRYRFAVAL